MDGDLVLSTRNSRSSAVSPLLVVVRVLNWTTTAYMRAKKGPGAGSALQATGSLSPPGVVVVVAAVRRGVREGRLVTRAPRLRSCRRRRSALLDAARARLPRMRPHAVTLGPLTRSSLRRGSTWVRTPERPPHPCASPRAQTLASCDGLGATDRSFVAKVYLLK